MSCFVRTSQTTFLRIEASRLAVADTFAIDLGESHTNSSAHRQHRNFATDRTQRCPIESHWLSGSDVLAQRSATAPPCRRNQSPSRRIRFSQRDHLVTAATAGNENLARLQLARVQPMRKHWIRLAAIPTGLSKSYRSCQSALDRRAWSRQQLWHVGFAAILTFIRRRPLLGDFGQRIRRVNFFHAVLDESTDQFCVLLN